MIPRELLLAIPWRAWWRFAQDFDGSGSKVHTIRNICFRLGLTELELDQENRLLELEDRKIEAEIPELRNELGGIGARAEAGLLRSRGRMPELYWQDLRALERLGVPLMISGTMAYLRGCRDLGDRIEPQDGPLLAEADLHLDGGMPL